MKRRKRRRPLRRCPLCGNLHGKRRVTHIIVEHLQQVGRRWRGALSW